MRCLTAGYAYAKAIYPGHQGGGILGTILLGIIGAFVGGSLGVFFTTRTLALAAPTLSIPGIALAVLGAIVAVFLWNLLTRRSDCIKVKIYISREGNLENPFNYCKLNPKNSASL